MSENGTPTKICKYCSSKIPKTAKVCPQCRRKLKGGKLKWIVIAVVLLFIFAASQGGGNKQKEGKIGTVKDGAVTSAESSTGNSSENEPDQAAASGTAAPDEAASVSGDEAAADDAPAVYHVGDVLQEDNLQIVYMSSGEYTEENEFLQPSEGHTYYYLQFAFENTSDSSDASVSMYQFKGFADGYNVEQYFGGEDQLSGTLSPRRVTYGKVFYEVPVDTQNFEVEYESNIFTGRKLIFAYEGEQDSGYTIEKDTTPSENACAVGGTAEEGGIKFTYLSCENYESDNQFMMPREGYHFVSCEFEVENTGSSDESVTMYSFDCYADGVTCEQFFGRDDALNASLSAGRKAKGTVTFEIPDDASCVELEYLTNVWTSKRLIFTIK